MIEVTRDPFLLWFTLESLADLERLSTSSETLDLRGLASEVPLPVLIESVLAGEPSASSSQPWYRLKSDLSLSSLCPFSVSWPWEVLFEFAEVTAIITCIDMGSPSAGLASYTVFIFIKPSRAAVSWTQHKVYFSETHNNAHGHSRHTWDIFPVNSSIFACSFFLRWLGGNSEKSSWEMGDIPVTFWKMMKWSIFYKYPLKRKLIIRGKSNFKMI